jgi:hypothetical protein
MKNDDRLPIATHDIYVYTQTNNDKTEKSPNNLANKNKIQFPIEESLTDDKGIYDGRRETEDLDSK